mgnify:CR=1 FL=1
MSTVHIFGGGLGGLSSAVFLATQKPENLTIHLYESTENLGGKMSSWSSDDRKTHREHSIRGIGSSYFNFRELYDRVGIPSGAMKPSAFFGVKDDKRFLLEIASLSKMGLHHILWFFYNISPILLNYNTGKQQSFEEAAQLNKLEPNTRTFVESLLGIIVGLRKESKAEYAVNMFGTLFQMMEVDELNKEICIFNGPTKEVAIDPIEKFLEEKNVIIHKNCRLTNVNKTELSYETENGIENISLGDDTMSILALPHEIIWSLGLLPNIKQSFSDVWSFGCQIRFYKPCEEAAAPTGEEYLPEFLKPFLGNKLSLIVESEWEIILTIHEGGVNWDRDYIHPDIYDVSITVSSAVTPGKLFGKSVPYCSKSELIRELLFQISGFQLNCKGANDIKNMDLSQISSVDEFYMKLVDSPYEGNLQPTEEMGPVFFNKDTGKNQRWIHSGQIYTANKNDPIVKTTNNISPYVFLAGEVVHCKGAIQIPTMEKVVITSKYACNEVLKKIGSEDLLNVKYSNLKSSYRKYLTIFYWLTKMRFVFIAFMIALLFLFFRLKGRDKEKVKITMAILSVPTLYSLCYLFLQYKFLQS